MDSILTFFVWERSLVLINCAKIAAFFFHLVMQCLFAFFVFFSFLRVEGIVNKNYLLFSEIAQYWEVFVETGKILLYSNVNSPISSLKLKSENNAAYFFYISCRIIKKQIRNVATIW